MPFSATPAAAQATSSGTVTGTVTDPTGAFIPGATVTVTDLSTKSTRTAISNAKGQFVLPDVPPGTYNMTATKTGFSTDQITGMTVLVGTQVTANFKMAVGGESTVVEVQASNADLQTMNASTGVTVDPAMVASLPAIGREVSTFLTMQPGVTPTGNVAGTTTDQATFQLDGGSNSSDMDGTGNTYLTSFANSTTGGFLGAGTAGVVPMPQDSVEEFKVTTTGQTADFNNSSGSQSQVVTKRGRDKVSGTVYEYYLDNNFNANTWSNNFPTAKFGPAVSPTGVACPTCIPTAGLAGSTSYTPKPSYHFSRFGAAVGGPIAPRVLGGKTYLFAMYEGFRYPQAGTYERTVPSYNFLQSGNVSGLPFGAVVPKTATFNGGNPAAITGGTGGTGQTYDDRGLGFNPTLKNFYNTQLPVAPVGLSGSLGNNGVTYPGVFDQSCGALSTSYCDGTNLIGYKTNVTYPQTSNFFVARMDHDFGAKWHFMASYRYYKLVNATTNQVSICGAMTAYANPATATGVGTPCSGAPVAVTPRPQVPWFGVIGLTTNVSTSLTNDFHYSYTRNLWQYRGPGDPPQLPGADAAIEPLGDNTTTVLSPYNVNSQSTRTRTWDGKDNFFSDNVTKLKGDHLIQIGGQFQHNFNYHLRTDNGATINYEPLYLIGDTSGGGGFSSSPLFASTGFTANANYARQLATYYGFVTDTQVLSTYINQGGTLTLQPAATPYAGVTTVPYYNIYATDTWHAKSSLTINYGISYALEMPPQEKYGNQSMWTDANGNPINVDSYLTSRKEAALAGEVYEPEIGFALVHNTATARKYPYDPYYGGVSPRVSIAWAPAPKSEGMKKLMGSGSTVIRVGYGRIFGRINGDLEVLNPLLSPPIILATQCKTTQPGTNGCNSVGYTDATAARFGTDGLSFAKASAAPPLTLGNVYLPGYGGPGVAIGSPLGTNVRPNDVDTFNVSIQRQINRKMLVEVGYIGRLIHHEYIMLNPNTVPYMMTQGGQSFESAYLAIETILGCTTRSGLCSNSAIPTTVTKQPFFETALGGATSTFCAAYANCTTALLNNTTILGDFRNQKVFSLWSSLDNNTLGAAASASNPQFVFARSMMGTPTSNTTYGSAGQVGSGIDVGTSDGYANYHGGYVSYTVSGFHGFTARENLTYSKALGQGSYTQSTSSTAPNDSFNLAQQYGRQPFDQKFIFNTFVVYETPWYKNQNGIVGRMLGGWTLSPVVSAGTGQPLTCTDNSGGGQGFGGVDGTNFSANENCEFTTRYHGGYHTHRGVLGSGSQDDVTVGTAVHAGSSSAAVNMFNNPAAIYDTTRPAILGLDARGGGYASISGLGYLNLDFSVKKRVVIYKQYALELSGVFNNALNHLDFNSPSLSIASPTSFGVTKTQGNSPRAIQMGVRAYF
jgi:hypothetical protein